MSGTSLDDVEAGIAKARAATAEAIEEWCGAIEDADAEDAERLFEQAAVIAETRAGLRRMVERLATMNESNQERRLTGAQGPTT